MNPSLPPKPVLPSGKKTIRIAWFIESPSSLVIRQLPRTVRGGRPPQGTPPEVSP